MNKLLYFICIIMLFIMSGCTNKEFNLNGDTNVYLEINEEYIDPGVNIPENYSVFIDGKVDTKTIGQYILNYNIIDAKGVSKQILSRIVNIVDTTAPSFVTIESIDLEVNEHNDVDWKKYIQDLSDNSNQNIELVINDNINYKRIGKYTVDIKALDGSGNEFTRTIKVTVKDTVAPSIEFNNSFMYLLGCNNINKIFISISDNYYDEKEITIESNLDEIGDSDVTGYHAVEFTISDPSGNISNAQTEIFFAKNIYDLFENLFINESDLIARGYKNNYPDGGYYYWLDLKDGNSIVINNNNRITFYYSINTEYGEGSISISSNYGLFSEAMVSLHIGSGINNYTAAHIFSYNTLEDTPKTNNTFNSYTINYLHIPKVDAEYILNSNILSTIEAFNNFLGNVGLYLK